MVSDVIPTSNGRSSCTMRAHRGWFRVANSFLPRHGPGLGPYGIAVYLCLASYTYKGDYPSIDAIAGFTGMSRRQVLSTIDRLEQLGYLRRNRAGRANQYTLLVPLWTGAGDAPISPPNGAGDAPIQAHIEENKKSARNKRAFRQFWQAYPPTGGDEAEAWKQWEKLSPSPELVQEILEALEAWKRSDRWQEGGGQFIPFPENWLKRTYWNRQPGAQQATETAGQRAERVQRTQEKQRQKYRM